MKYVWHLTLFLKVTQLRKKWNIFKRGCPTHLTLCCTMYHTWHITKNTVILIICRKFGQYDCCNKWRTVQKWNNPYFPQVRWLHLAKKLQFVLRKYNIQKNTLYPFTIIIIKSIYSNEIALSKVNLIDLL